MSDPVHLGSKTLDTTTEQGYANPQEEMEASGKLDKNNVPWGVNEIDGIQQPISWVQVVQTHGLELDSNATLALQVHVVQQLRLHIAATNRISGLDEPVG